MCVSVCKSQWLLNLICQQINGRSQLAAATSRSGESFSTQNTFQISSSHLLLLLRLLLFFFFQRELLDLTPAWISSSFSLEKTISLFISGQRPINQFFSSRLSKQKKSRKEFHTQGKYQIFHSSSASLAWLSSRFWLHNVRSAKWYKILSKLVGGWP